MTADHYIIRGGLQGRERLRLLARVMEPTTSALLNALGVGPGMTCLDVGCGGGDVSLLLAGIVGPSGRVVGCDIDETKLAMAVDEVMAADGVDNVEYRPLDVLDQAPAQDFDLVYARFLLTHLPDPTAAAARLAAAAKPGGLVVVEDIDVSGSFCEPANAFYQRYLDLYTRAARRRGGDPDIGPRLPGLLREVGCTEVAAHVVQPCGLTGEVKLVSSLTMENIAEAVLAEGLATKEAIEETVDGLYALAADGDTFMSIPRVVQAWGRRPQA